MGFGGRLREKFPFSCYYLFDIVRNSSRQLKTTLGIFRFQDNGDAFHSLSRSADHHFITGNPVFTG